MSEWKEYRLGDVGKIVTGKTPKTAITDNYGGNIPFLSPSDNMELKYVPITARHLTEKGLADVKSCLIPENSVCVSCIGSDMGKSVITVRPIVTNQQINSIIPSSNFDTNFLYYILQNKKREIKFLGRNGTAVPILNKSAFSNLTIFAPELDEQRSIASILSSLDSKIENNRKICANLEAQAQALFKHWFIDFAPFKDGKFVESELGMIPEGWRVGTLTDILENIKDTTKQGDYPELPYLPIDSIPMNSFLVKDIKDNSEAQSSLILFKKYDILIGAMRVYFHRVIPAPFDGITRSTCFVVRPKDWNYYSFALCSVNSNQAILHAQKTSKGSTMPYAVWEGGLGAFSIVIPPETVAREFDNLIMKYINIIQYAYFENQKLTSLRDSLLPKLMSGEIKV